MSSEKIIYLPIENQARELESKILLALFAHERGWRPIFGYKKFVRDKLHQLPQGLYLSHNARYGMPGLFDEIYRYGHRIAVLDEESLVRQTDKLFILKHEIRAFEKVDLLLAWGKNDQKLYQKSGLIPPNLVIATGNPRIDLLRPEMMPYYKEDVSSIKAKFGEYVLLNTNYATVNNFRSKHPKLRLAMQVASGDDLITRKCYLEHKKQLFEKYLQAIPLIANAIYPLTLVIRPHPSENHQPWRMVISGITNAHIVFERSVVPWLLGSRALIHNGCTSAIEAALLKVPVLTFRPGIFSAFDNCLPNEMGVSCQTIESVRGALDEILLGRDPSYTENRFEFLSNYIEGFSGDFCCTRIFNALESQREKKVRALPMDVIARIKKEISIKYLQLIGVSPFSERYRRREKYTHHKFPSIGINTMNSKIDQFRVALGRFKGHYAVELGQGLFEITSN